MSECYGFTNPIVIESDAYFYLRKEVEAYRAAIGALAWELERRREYLRACRKADQSPDNVTLADHDIKVADARLAVIEAYEGFVNAAYP